MYWLIWLVLMLAIPLIACIPLLLELRATALPVVDELEGTRSEKE
jgi:hypothetical protein